MAIADICLKHFPKSTIIWGVSSFIHDNVGQRVFPENFNALSDIRHFLKPDRACVPQIHPKAMRAGHGLWHLDHRLMGYEWQTASILTSCALVKGKIFIPPFNKYNDNTIEICQENGIQLIKYEDGWKSAEYNKFNKDHSLWYLHAWRWKPEIFETWLIGEAQG